MGTATTTTTTTNTTTTTTTTTISTSSARTIIQANKLIRFKALQTACQSHFINSPMSKQAVLDSLDQVMLVLDEVVDDGLIMETDDDKISNRVRMLEDTENMPARPANTHAAALFDQATSAAKKRLMNSLLGGGDR